MNTKAIFRKAVFILTSVVMSFAAAQTLPINNMPDQTRINKALPKAIIGTSIFCIGEALAWAIVYPKDKALENKLFDTYDEETGETYTMAERSEQLFGESLQLTLLGIPFSAMRIAGTTAACINATKSTSSTRRMLSRENLSNPVWAPYISGWALGLVGSMAGMISGFSQTRGPLKVARVMSIGQSTLWGVSGILSITTSARNSNLIKSKETTGWRISPKLDTYCYGMNFDWDF
jgi:hypothetical protein